MEDFGGFIWTYEGFNVSLYLNINIISVIGNYKL